MPKVDFASLLTLRGVSNCPVFTLGPECPIPSEWSTNTPGFKGFDYLYD